MDRVGLSGRGRSMRSGGVKLQKPEGVIKGFYGLLFLAEPLSPPGQEIMPLAGLHRDLITPQGRTLDRPDFTPYKAACPDAA